MKNLRGLWLLAAIPTIHASNLPGTTFVNPPSDDNTDDGIVRDTVHQIDTIYPVEWLTNLTSYSVWLYQQVGDVSSGAQQVFINDPAGQQFGFSWNISVGILPIERSNIYFLVLSNGTASSDLARSERSKFFNLTEGPVPSVLSGFPTTVTALSTITSIMRSTTDSSSLSLDASLSTSSEEKPSTLQTSTLPTSTTIPSQATNPSSSSQKSYVSISLIVGASVFLAISLTIFFGYQIYKRRQRLSQSSKKPTAETKDLKNRVSRLDGPPEYKARLVKFWWVNNGVPVELNAERERGELE